MGEKLVSDWGAGVRSTLVIVGNSESQCESRVSHPITKHQSH